jgi:hypothetical protein
MKFKTRALAAAALALTVLGAQAHDLWFKPSSTVLSKSDWVTVDAAVSNDVFFFNHRPLGLEAVKVTAPDGAAVEMKNVAKGELRSMFDFKPEKTGTYRVTMLMTGVMGGYKDANGQPKRLRGSVEEVLKQIPCRCQGSARDRESAPHGNLCVSGQAFGAGADRQGPGAQARDAPQ